MTDFLAIDGEAIPDRYNLLACSNGESVLNMEELSTCECLDFLLSLSPPEDSKDHKKKPVIVCFGLNYDANMWLRDLNREALEFIWNTGECVYAPSTDPETWYKLEWLPGHRFRIQRGGMKVTIYEVWGFFQSSFVTALGKWGLESSPELEFMKSHRGAFGPDEIGRVKDYCHTECSQLVELMERLESACVQAGIVPREWMGAGALAGKMLADRKWMKLAHRHDSDLGPEEAQEPILCAYFGGRVELLKQGEFKHVHTADIRSAYPHAITQLPSLENSILTHRENYNPGEPHAIWHVAWSDLPGVLMPFPVRYKKSVCYPTSGEGWYHACEVTMALELGYKFEVLEGWVLKCEDDTPFSFVPELFDLRNEWKTQGLAAEKVLKLGLNSLYGKLAQGVGFKRKPPWQSYFWAGEVTARTRSRMLEAAHAAGPDNCIMISTDGLFHTNKDALIHDTNELGGWEVGGYDALFAGRAGVYLGEKGEEEVLRSRGFFAREVNFHDLREAFQREGVFAKHEYTSKRFVGIGSALMRRDFGAWRTWEESVRTITMMPTGKRVDLSLASGSLSGAFLPHDGALPPSEPYEPKGKYDKIEERVQEAEQPLKEG